VWTEERRAKASKTMKDTNNRYHEQFAERMKTDNPMKREEIRKAVSDKLKEINHKPLLRGGNGTGMTTPQRMLVDELLKKLIDLTVCVEYPIPTKAERSSGYPTCYKVDIALIEPMIAIEVDGNSHCAIVRQEQDKKKDAFLSGLGWTVLRFKNKQVTEHLADCVQMVMSTISR
jgi:hypothetical protein